MTLLTILTELAVVLIGVVIGTGIGTFACLLFIRWLERRGL